VRTHGPAPTFMRLSLYYIPYVCNATTQLAHTWQVQRATCSLHGYKA
jgi:hypothetical protein